ncbi:MAG TPA: hypothetical protein VH915_06120 [Pedococcus sp.]
MTGGLAARVAAVYLALRAVTALIVLLAVDDQVPVDSWTGPDVDYFDMTVLWDGSWYREVALNGYPADLPLDPTSGRPSQNAWAFYPLYPLLARGLMGVTGLSFPVAASTLALLCGLGAALLMAGLLAERVGQRVALAAVAAWAAFPSAVALQLSYTESLAMLVLCGFLWAVMRERWAVAAALALVLGITRPIALPLLAVVAVALLQRWRQRRERPVTAGEYLAGAGALAACTVSGLTWPTIAWAVTGAPTAYTDTMAAWRADGEIVPLKPWLWMSQWVFREHALAGTYGPVALAAVVTTLVVMVLGPWATRLGPELRTWCLAYPAYLGLVLDPFTSIFRYLLPLFPLLVVMLGGGWADRRPRWLPARAGLLVAAGVAGQVAWVFGLLVFNPPSDYPP